LIASAGDSLLQGFLSALVGCSALARLIPGSKATEKGGGARLELAKLFEYRSDRR